MKNKLIEYCRRPEGKWFPVGLLISAFVFLFFMILLKTADPVLLLFSVLCGGSGIWIFLQVRRGKP